MKALTLITLLFLIKSSLVAQTDYLKMKDTICPKICGIADSSLVIEIYSKLRALDTSKMTSGKSVYYEDLSDVLYDLCLWNHQDSAYMRLSLLYSEKSLFYNPNNHRMIWSAAFGYSVFGECEKTLYYLSQYYEKCPKRYRKDQYSKGQIGILLTMCPDNELKKKFRLN